MPLRDAGQAPEQDPKRGQQRLREQRRSRKPAISGRGIWAVGLVGLVGLVSLVTFSGLGLLWKSRQTAPEDRLGSIDSVQPTRTASPSLQPSLSSSEPPLLMGDTVPDKPSGEGEPAATRMLHVRPDKHTVFLTAEQLRIQSLLPAARDQMASAQVAGPVSLQVLGDQLFFLARGALYQLALPQGDQISVPAAVAQEKMPTGRRIQSGERIRELFAMGSDGQQLWLLDKSNDLYRYSPATGPATSPTTGNWQAEQLAYPGNEQPDPHYLSLTAAGGRLWLLDYARNQIWWKRPGQARLQQAFAQDVMSWNLRPGDRDLSQGVDLAVDLAGDRAGNLATIPDLLVLTAEGQLNRYRRGQKPEQPWIDLAKLPRPFVETDLQPAWRRVVLSQGKLLVLDAGLRRVLQLRAGTGQLERQYVLAGGPLDWNHLHDVFLSHGQLYLLAGNSLLHFAPEAVPTAQPADIAFPLVPQSDHRLQGFIPPLATALLPDNFALFPGSRRIYRQGIHEGADFFDRFQPQTGGQYVHYGSAVRAIKAGRVLRADRAFREIPAAEYPQILAACRRNHETSRAHEDRFRGRQVWLEHEGGVISIYAHLSAIPASLRPGQPVAQGQTIGEVGNSGTSNSIAGNRLNPHLHLEIWLSQPDDPVHGEYLGKWLSFAETRSLWEQLLAGGQR